MSTEGHWCGPKPCPECGETHACICGNDCDKPVDAEQEFRDWITAEFKAGKIGIENGWLFEYTEPCPSPGPYGCPPGCHEQPLLDLWRADAAEHARLAELREARAETWDEAVSAVFAWWSAPEGDRPALIVNPYGVGLPVPDTGAES